MCSLLLPLEDRSPALRGVTQTAPSLLSFSSFTSRHRSDLDTLRAKLFHGFPLPTETACLDNSECRSGFVFVFLTPKEFVIQWERQGCAQMSQHMVCLLLCGKETKRGLKY